MRNEKGHRGEESERGWAREDKKVDEAGDTAEKGESSKRINK